jgi:hypothetical protein
MKRFRSTEEATRYLQSRGVIVKALPQITQIGDKLIHIPGLLEYKSGMVGLRCLGLIDWLRRTNTFTVRTV